MSESNKRRLYIANDDHTDMMWTADEETYARVFVELLDFHLALADETADNPAPYRNRFNADGSFWLWEYARQKTPAEFARLIESIRAGVISAPLTTLVSCYGAQPAEAVLRGMYYAGRLERRYNLRFPQAVAMENQTLPLGLASLWAGAGAKYTWRGICGCASRMDRAKWGERDHEIYWYTCHDGQRLLMKWHSLASGDNKESGGYAEAFDPIAAVAFLDADPDFLRRYRAPGASESYHVRGAFGFGWDALDRKTGQPYPADPDNYPAAPHFHVVAQEQTTRERQVIVSNQEDFFRDFEANYGAALPSQTVTYGNEWDLYSASMVETSAAVRRAVEKLRAAEALATLVSLKTPDFLTGRVPARDRAFVALGLYWEHDWTADGPISREARAAWQESVAGDICGYVEDLHRDAAGAFGGLIAGGGENIRFYAFNPLGWSRDDVADFAYDGPEEIYVRDAATGESVPYEFVVVAGDRGGLRRGVRIWARDVPPVGYKAFEILPGGGDTAHEPAAKVSADRATIENARVRLVVGPNGVIRSLIDKARPDHDFAAAIGGLALNDFGAEQTNRDSITVTDSGPVSVTLVCDSHAQPKRRTAITLYRDSDRIDIRNEITENFADVRHWAFSFNLDAPIVHTEEVGAIVRVRTQSRGGDYAERNARYDYATLNHFADISDAAQQRGVTLSNADLSFVRLGNSTPNVLDDATPQLHVLAGGQADGEGLGIIAQNGATRFRQRFALRLHNGYDPTAAMKFALEHQNPLVTGAITGDATAPYPPDRYGLLTITHPDALLWAVKPAEEGIGAGVIVRLWNVSDQPLTAEVRFTPGLTAARRATHIETDIKEIPLSPAGHLPASFARQQMQTYRVIG